MEKGIILGTSPEIIKMSPVIRECKKQELDYFILHTGQHYSYNMDKIFCFGVLQHTPDVRKAFLSLVPYLKEGGGIVVDAYEKKLSLKYFLRSLLRSFTKRIDNGKLYKIVTKTVPVLLPVSISLRRIPIFGGYLSSFIPVANYKGILPIKDEDFLDWAILDTFDMLSPRYENRQTVKSVTEWFSEAGLTNIQVTSVNGTVVGKGIK